MPYPSVYEDKVLYDLVNLYPTEDITIRMQDYSRIRIYGDLLVNGNPVQSNIFVDVRDFGAKGDGVTDDAPAIQAAINSLVYPVGGTVYIPNGTFRLNTGLVINYQRVALQGADPTGTELQYYGNGTAIDIATDGQVRLEGFRLRNSGSAGLKGIIVGSVTNYTGFRYELSKIDIYGFLTYGLHVANCELSLFERIYVDGQGVGTTGIFVDNSRHTNAAANGGWNIFNRCRVYNCTSYGWDMDKQTGNKYTNCESLSNAGSAQVFLHGTTYCCSMENWDCEDILYGGTKSGLLISGAYHTIEGFLGFSLNKGVEFSAATGCYLGPSRFSTVTTPLTIGGTCQKMLIFDAGNLGSVTEGAPTETNYIGRVSRTGSLAISGTVNTGYLEFRAEQTSNPAGAVDRCRLFIKDNGSGKTQLMAVFGTGAAVQIAIEP